jgi:aminoglycoside 3-N-acetyltransferase
MNDEGWVLLLGVDQTVNTSIHYGEILAGRKQFVRWSLTPKGVVACPGFPGCSDGFSALSPHLTDSVRKVEVGEAVIQAIPLEKLVDSVCAMIKDAPLALLCEREDCERCNAVRDSTSVK